MKVQSTSVTPADYAANAKPQTSGHVAAPAPAAERTQNAPVSSPAQQVKQPSDAELREALALLQQKAQTAAPNLQFSIDRDSSRVVIKVTDSSTREVIRQFPPEEILHLDKELTRLQGLLFSKQA